jgi:nitrile hydratase
MHGFGPIDREEHDLADWERRVGEIMHHALGRAGVNLDAFRYGIEQMEPAGYLASPYYQRWLTTVEYNLVQAGVLAEGELDARLPPPEHWPKTIGSGPPARDGFEVPDDRSGPPRFTYGDAVITRNINPAGHTRLPRYARGKRGAIHRVYGSVPLPDSNAHDLGEHRQPVYSVRFEARELWGDAAEPNATVAIDLWECYLEPDRTS